MFERPTNVRRGSSSTSSAYTSLVVTKLHSQLQSTRTELQTTQSELQMTRAQLQATKEKLGTIKEDLEATMKQLDNQRIGFLELNAWFESFSTLLGHLTTRAGTSQEFT